MWDDTPGGGFTHKSTLNFILSMMGECAAFPLWHYHKVRNPTYTGTYTGQQDQGDVSSSDTTELEEEEDDD